MATRSGPCPRTVVLSATTTATASKIVARDSNGDVFVVNSRVAGNLFLTAASSQIVQTDVGAEASDAGSGEYKVYIEQWGFLTQ